MGKRLSVGCQRASQSLRAAQALANHLHSLHHLLPFCLSLSLRLSHSLPLSNSLVSSFFVFLAFTSLSLFLSISPFLPHLPLVSSSVRSSPSFPSVPSSPRCSMLQARYNAACRRPSCIFKRAVLLCSRYRPHHLDRPLDDRSPPSPTSVSLSPFLSLSPLYIFITIFLFCGLHHYSHRFRACELSLFSMRYDAIKNFSEDCVRIFISVFTSHRLIRENLRRCHQIKIV